MLTSNAIDRKKLKILPSLNETMNAEEKFEDQKIAKLNY